MRPKRRVEEQVVVLEFRHPGVQSHVVQEGAGRHRALVPVGFVVPAPFGGQELLLDVVVVARGHDGRGFDFRAVRQRHSGGAAPRRRGWPPLRQTS